MALFLNRFMPWRFAEIAAGTTQEKIAERLNCSVGQVNMLLSGKRKFHSDWITKIAAAWGIPEWQLFARPEDVLPPEYIKWQEAYSRLDEHRRIIVDDMLKAAMHTEPDKDSSLKKTKKLHTGV